MLRDEWRFNGFVVTDYTAINELVPHGVARDEAHAAELAANAGIEMDMTGGVFHAHLLQAVKEGKVNEETIDNAVRRILEMKFLLGIMDDPYRYLNEEREKATIMKPEFLEAARDAARKSVVLLKNENNFFPIQPSERKTVALIGPMVKERNSVNGGWGGRGDRQRSVTLFEGLEKSTETRTYVFFMPKAAIFVSLELQDLHKLCPWLVRQMSFWLLPVKTRTGVPRLLAARTSPCLLRSATC